eukprot:c20492_g1_i1.p1 GENE.c20492_g1_i1~~c20492_g1_i1.p1  ORF type:complete len:434 (-),score=135.37 c20492_g1_i1:13-1314(-)
MFILLFVFVCISLLLGSANACDEVLIVTDPQIEHTSNKGLLKHPFNDIFMNSLINQIQDFIDRQCPVFISAHLILPNSCQILSLSEMTTPAISEWFFGPPLIQYSQRDTKGKATAQKQSGEQITQDSYKVGGPQSVVQRNVPDESRNMIDDDGLIIDEEDVSNSPLRKCKAFPAFVRGRCNYLRQDIKQCFQGDQKSKVVEQKKWPPMLIPGQGGSFDSRLVTFLNGLGGGGDVHIVINGAKQFEDRFVDFSSWSMLENESLCVTKWDTAKLIMDNSLFSSRAKNPTSKQNIPLDQEVATKLAAVYPTCLNENGEDKKNPFIAALTSKKIKKIVISGYSLDFTIVDTISSIYRLYNTKETKAKPDEDLSPREIKIKSSLVVSIFPERYNNVPPVTLPMLPRKIGMQSLVEELSLRGVIIDFITDSLSGIPIDQ